MIGKWLVLGGVLVTLLDAAFWLVEWLGLPLGRVPGDIRLRGEGWSFSLPLVTCIVAGIVLTGLLNLAMRFFR